MHEGPAALRSIEAKPVYQAANSSLRAAFECPFFILTSTHPPLHDYHRLLPPPPPPYLNMRTISFLALATPALAFMTPMPATERK